MTEIVDGPPPENLKEEEKKVNPESTDDDYQV